MTDSRKKNTTHSAQEYRQTTELQHTMPCSNGDGVLTNKNDIHNKKYEKIEFGTSLLPFGSEYLILLSYYL
jgi:hypothetical protein